mgnify:CR=1 FL=1
MDIIGADFYNVLKMMVERLNAHPVAIQIPIGSEDTFQGLIDLIKNESCNLRRRLYKKNLNP